MTITGIDSTGQSPGGNALPPRGTAGTEDLDAELLALDSDVAAAPILVIPATRAAPESEPETPRPSGFRNLFNWRDVLALVSFIAVALFLTSPLWLHLDHAL